MNKNKSEHRYKKKKSQHEQQQQPNKKSHYCCIDLYCMLYTMVILKKQQKKQTIKQWWLCLCVCRVGAPHSPSTPSIFTATTRKSWKLKQSPATRRWRLGILYFIYFILWFMYTQEIRYSHGRHSQLVSLASAAHLLNAYACVSKQAQWEQ